MRTGVVLVAGGLSRRFGRVQPKQFRRLNGRPMYQYALRAFLEDSTVREIAIVVPPSFIKRIQNQVRALRPQIPVTVVAGGHFRGESVKNGYSALQTNPDVILIHDAARPLVTSDIISRVRHGAKKHGAALAAWPLADTLKQQRRTGEIVARTIPRDGLWLAQTPQGFNAKRAAECLLHPVVSATDDVALSEKRGQKVALVKGSPTNFKITYPHDWTLSEALIKK